MSAYPIGPAHGFSWPQLLIALTPGTFCAHLPEFFRHLLDEVRSSMKLSRSRLQQVNGEIAS